MKYTDLLTSENIKELGFVYNYYDGFSYQTIDGFMLSRCNLESICYRGKWYDCKTVGEFLGLRVRVRKAELDKEPLNFDKYDTSKIHTIEL